jgi:cytochrome bd-type quinol oxidase subunit 2
MNTTLIPGARAPSQTQLLAEKMAAAPSSMILTVVLVILPIIAVFFAKQSRDDKTKRPPRLDETIPFVSNLWQFMTNKRLFITRAR